MRWSEIVNCVLATARKRDDVIQRHVTGHYLAIADVADQVCARMHQLIKLRYVR